MQLIEVSLTGVRSAVITLEAAGTPVRFVLFPMIHLGTPDFYRSVTARLAECDLIVAEGIYGRSITVAELTLAYRLPARQRRLGLTLQKTGDARLGVPVIRPDITAQQFRAGWRSVPWLQRLAVACLVPPFALALALLGTRRTFSRYLNLDDLPDHLHGQAEQALPELTDLILDRRDALLVECLVSIHDAHQAGRVAVVYGAGHMPAVTREMFRRFGYRPRTAEWLTVFDF